jgi:predicted 3-demethylubiquinone-9 3-methyltransferase (glyoxalase superfamily)
LFLIFQKFNPSGTRAFALASNPLIFQKFNLKPLETGALAPSHHIHIPKLKKSHQASGTGGALALVPNFIIKMKTITPCLWFDSQAEEAVKFYISVFPNSKINHIERYGESASPASGMKKGSVMTVTFTLNGNDFMALNGGPAFKFSEAISFITECEDQKEMDYYYKKLSAVPEAEQCGWLKDKFGISWQLIPKGFEKMMENTDSKKKEKMMAALLKMKRINIKKLEQAGEER